MGAVLETRHAALTKVGGPRTQSKDNGTLAANVRAGYALGWSFTPLRGKIPRRTGWVTRPRETLDDALQWGVEGNVGLRCGKASGVIVIDSDAEGDVRPLKLPPTPTVRTGGEGRSFHFYFKMPDVGIGNSASKLGPHIDVRGQGGQVVFPGSVHPATGDLYSWVEGLSPSDVDLADLPQNVIDLLKPKIEARPAPSAVDAAPGTAGAWASKALEDEFSKVSSAPEGARNEALNDAAFSLAQIVAAGHLDRETVRQRLNDAAARCGLGVHEAESTIQSGFQGGEKEPRGPKAAAPIEVAAGQKGGKEELPAEALYTDYMNSERLVKLQGGNLRYCGNWAQWLCWNGRRWKRDDTFQVLKYAKKAAKGIFAEAKGAADPARMAKHGVASLKRERLSAMEFLARPELAIESTHLDRNGWLLNLHNGTLNLQTGELQKHRRDDLITMLAPVRFDAKATCPLWLGKMLPLVMGGDPDMIFYLQQLAGMWLSGDISEQILPVFYGDGENGKNTYLGALMGMLGEYAEKAPPKLLIQQKYAQHPTELANLYGRRLVVASETDQGETFRVALVKELTGDDQIKGRYMRGDYFEFDRTHKMVMCTNNPPAVKEQSHAIWRRLHAVPWNVRIPEKVKDGHLSVKLKREYPGILNWALAGCLSWQEKGLIVPDIVEAATAAYRLDQDPLAEFVPDRLVFAGKATCERKELLQEYNAWAEAEGEKHPIGAARLYRSIRRMEGVTDTRERHDGKLIRLFRGVGIKCAP